MQAEINFLNNQAAKLIADTELAREKWEEERQLRQEKWDIEKARLEKDLRFYPLGNVAVAGVIVALVGLLAKFIGG